MEDTKNLLTLAVAVMAIMFFSLLSYWVFWLNHVEINEIGVAYDSLDGTVTVQSVPGWYRTNPFVKVAYVSTLPLKVEIPSEARIIVAKIVRFKIEGLNEFIRLQGFSYSLNTSLKSILLGYAFSGNEYPFFEIMQEAGTENVEELRPLKMGEPSKK